MKKQLLLTVLLVCLSALIAFAGPMDTRSLIEYKPAIASETLAADTLSDPIYVNDYKACNIIIESGVATYTATDTILFQLLESDASNGTFTPVLPFDIRGNNVDVDASGTFQALSEALADVNVSETAYMGGAQYLKVKAYIKGVASGPCRVFIIKTHPYLGF